MDQATHESKRNCDNLSQVNGVICDNSRNSVSGLVLDAVAVTNSVEAVSISRENGNLGSKIDDVGSNRPLVEASEVIINHDTCNCRVITENSSNSVDGESLETLIVRNSEQNTDFNEEKGHLELKIDEMGSSGEVVNAPDTCNRQGIGEGMGQTDNGNSCNLVDAVVLETVIVINLDQTACSRGENRDLEVVSNELGSSMALVENVSGKVSKPEKESCVIDMMKCSAGDGKGLRENPDGERVCRICHLDSEQLLESMATSTVSSTAVNLIQLGCGCKDELGVAHSHCAEAWFKLKGNRLCEICGQSAKNITGVGDYRFMEEWNGRRFIGGSSSSERGGCWRGQPFCNFLMACLVIAFVLPWFFRVNMF